MGRGGRSKPNAAQYRSASTSLFLLLATVGWGLAVRFAPLGLPRFLSKYGGSALWALAIYWLVSAFAASRKLVQATFVAGLMATAVELGKLLHAPWLDTFRRTLPGVLLLGRHFSLQDLLAYWLAIVCGYLIDSWLCRRRARG